MVLMATERLRSLVSHLSAPIVGIDAILQKNPDDVVITLAVRTPLTKSHKGGFKDTDLDYMIYALLREMLAKSNVDPLLVEDICLANVADPKATYKIRGAMLAAGFPYTSGASSVSRFCGSGLKAIQDMANQISRGDINIGIAIGGESMTTNRAKIDSFSPALEENQYVRECLQPMIQTSENLVKDFNISRRQQDEYAVESFRRAERAQKAGWFDDETVSIRTKVKDLKTVEETTVILSKDEGPRYGTTLESLSKLKSVKPDFGNTTTAGNASQVTDGAAGLLMMKRSKAWELGQPILGKFCGATVAGVPPRIMGTGPAAAIPKLLQRFGLRTEDIDIFEINEAFANMAIYCIDVLGLDYTKVNPRGGAIALGHPVGATGVRQVCTGLSEARRSKKRVLLTSMCIGSGQGMAGLFVNEQL